MKCVILALLLCLPSYSCVAANATASDKVNLTIQGDLAAGKIKSEDNRCQECHGPDGNGQGPATGAAGKFAKLAGQSPDYMLKQIREFRTGERKHDLMSIMAKSIDDSDAADIAAYFASQTKMQGDGSGGNPSAEAMFNLGDANRNIVACVSCHGIKGKGIDTPHQLIPVIGGQEWHYLEKQLLDWRSGERKNSAGAVMNSITKQLTNDEIRLLTDYISGL
ncbi:MAG: c-type cytochrome [Moraxellaceae bacterium]|nr:MAG: c-type cytochrome [Moraxellaceae bacterium]